MVLAIYNFNIKQHLEERLGFPIHEVSGAVCDEESVVVFYLHNIVDSFHRYATLTYSEFQQIHNKTYMEAIT